MMKLNIQCKQSNSNYIREESCLQKKKERMSVWDILSSVILFCSHAYNYSANAAVMIAME